MKRIGLLGGMSWESTAEYYRLINTAVAQRLGGLHSADLVMVSVDFAVIEQMQASGRWDEAGALLAREAARLESAGAALIALCTNTMHKVAPMIEAAVSVPLLHLADSTAGAVIGANIARAGLLGTAFTMEQDFYRGRLEAAGLQVLIPDEAGRAEVHRIIYDELCHGVVRAESRQRYLDIIADLVAAGADGIILGCTEIELLLPPDAADLSPVPLFPTSRIHALAAVELALADTAR